ncbi:MAG TPA: TRAP transporter substrate-binding protein [Casimicrobiaceae bacterium]|nr:TRAP transporter substrate-binding protein [Casimicrobiaceae bacterium]
MSCIRYTHCGLAAAIVALAFGVAASASAQQPLTLRIGHNTPVGTPTDVGVKRFAQLVAERSGGKIVIRDYPAGQIGNEQQMIEGLQTGSIDMAGIIGATFGNVVPEYSVLGVLYVFRDPDHMRKVMSGPVGAEMAAALEKKSGIKVIDGAWYYGTRQLTSNRPVKTPADMVGMKIRVVPVPIFQASWAAVGATPTPVDFKELFTALQTNAVDAQENPLATTKGGGIHLVNKFLSLTDHTVANVVIAMSGDTWKRLKPDQRELITKAVHDAAAVNDAAAVKSEHDILAEFKAAGVTVIEPDKQAFREKVKDVPATFQNGVLLPLYKKIQDVK